jgi:hypothetical protein
VRKLRRADELTAEGKTGEEIAAELGVSPATLYNWRRAYGRMDTDAAKELKELRGRTPASSGCWPRLSWSKTRCGRSRKYRPSCQAARRGHAHHHV